MVSTRVRAGRTSTPALRRIGVGVVAAGAVFTVTACGSSSASGGSTTSGGSGSKGTVGVIFNSEADPNQQTILKGMQKVGTADGWKFTTNDANNDAATANDLMQSMVTRKVTAIVEYVFDPTGLASGIAAANAAHIPVYAIGAGYGHPKGLTGAARQDAGGQETQAMVDALGGKKAAVLAFTNRAGSPCVVAEQRFDTIMKSHPEISVTKANVPNPQAEQFGENTTDAWLQSHPAGKEKLAIWGCYDGPGLGSVVALKQANRTDVPIYGAYGQAEALQDIQQGTYTATWYYDLYSDGQHVMNDINSGKFSVNKPDLWQTKAIEVNKSTIAGFLKKFPNAIQPTS